MPPGFYQAANNPLIRCRWFTLPINKNSLRVSLPFRFIFF